MTKRRYSTEESFNWDLCILCQVEHPTEKLSCPASLERTNLDPLKTYQNILNNLHRFAELRKLPFEKEHISDEHFNNPQTFLEKKGKFHRTCQLKINTLKLERLEKSLAKQRCADESEAEKCEPVAECRRTERINNKEDEKIDTVCFFCHKEEGKLHVASTYYLNDRVFHIAKLLNNVEIISKLTEKDMMAWEAVYHSDCLIKFYKKGKEIDEKERSDFDTLVACTAFAELTEYMSDCAEEDKNTIFKLDDFIKLYEKRISDLVENIR